MTAPKLRKLSHADPVLLTSTLGLLGGGMVMMFSSGQLLAAERYGSSAYFLRHQAAYAAAGLVLMGILYFMNIRGLRKLALPALAGVSILLLLAAATSAGVSAKHATRWLSFGGFSFQPSEFAKPAIVLYVAAYLSKRGEKIRDFRKGLLPLLLTVGAVLFLVLKQPDFGTCVAMAVCVFMMLFVGRARFWHLGALCSLGMAATWFLVQGASYRRARLLAFLNPWEDAQNKGYQILQSFVAFQRGGLTGRGLGDGTQNLLFLPEAHTDFIFSVIAEELGLLGSVAVILLFAILVWRGFQVALRIREPFASQLAFGLTAMIGLQALINMAVVTGLVPTKGLTLPLLSYGGSSLVTTMASIGVLLSLSATVSAASMARRWGP